MRPTTDFFTGNRPDGPGLNQRWRFEPALRTVKAAGTAGAALQRQYASSREAGQLPCVFAATFPLRNRSQIQDLKKGRLRGATSLGTRRASRDVDIRAAGWSFRPWHNSGWVATRLDLLRIVRFAGRFSAGEGRFRSCNAWFKQCVRSRATRWSSIGIPVKPGVVKALHGANGKIIDACTVEWRENPSGVAEGADCHVTHRLGRAASGA